MSLPTIFYSPLTRWRQCKRVRQRQCMSAGDFCALALVWITLCQAFLPWNFVVQASDDNPSGCARSYPLIIPEAAVKTHSNKDKLIIAHRGASFHLPEHSIPAYRLALELGADFVEPDLVATKDGRLIAMHTVDLNVTTNVVDVFGSSRSPWFSPFANRSGYWTYNFTLEEIQQLRVKQRIPRARTTAFDGMFTVPTFVEIQQLVQSWNEERIPQLLLHVDANEDSTTPPGTAPPGNSTAAQSPLQVHTHYQQSAGMYAELKSTPWFQKDANINLVDLMLQELSSQTDIFQSILQCPDIFRFDEYKVPPLVVQSFEAEALQELTEKWQSHPDPAIHGAPIPPMILLISHNNCWEEGFWFDIGDKWRKYIQGVGMDKACFPKVGEYVEEGEAAKGRAEEFKLAIHPYTERPEHEYLMDGFQDDFEEMQYLFCTVGAQGVFSESVSTATMAARMGCPKPVTGEGEKGQDATTAGSGGVTTNNNNNPGENGAGGDSTSAAASSEEEAKPSLCWEDTSEANLYVGLASFVMGSFLTALLMMWVNRGFSFTPRPPREQQVPSDDIDAARTNNSIEEPPDDELL